MPHTRDRRAWISVLSTLTGEIALVFSLSILVVVLHDELGLQWVFISTFPLQIFGIALSVFLAFLNNTAYQRWWEARTLWGAIINHSRTYARQVLTLIQTSNAQEKEACAGFRRDIVRRQIAYAYSLRDALWDEPQGETLHAFLSATEIQTLDREKNSPLALLHFQGEALQTARERNWLTELAHMNLDNTLTEITNAQGGCERIKNTLIPSPYRVFSHNLVLCFCCAIPFGLVANTGAKTILIATMTALGFFTLERVGSMLAEPFRPDVNGLPLDRLVETIEQNLTGRLGD